MKTNRKIKKKNQKDIIVDVPVNISTTSLLPRSQKRYCFNLFALYVVDSQPDVFVGLYSNITLLDSSYYCETVSQSLDCKAVFHLLTLMYTSQNEYHM